MRPISETMRRPVLHVALVVVRHLEHEQLLRERMGHAVFLPFSVPADASQATSVAGEIMRSST